MSSAALTMSGPQESGTWSVVAVQGEVDLSTAPQFREGLGKAIEHGMRSLAVDLREVTFMDSMGLGVLVGARRHVMESGGRFAVICGEGPCQRVIEISGLSDLLGVVKDDASLPSD